MKNLILLTLMAFILLSCKHKKEDDPTTLCITKPSELWGHGGTVNEQSNSSSKSITFYKDSLIKNSAGVKTKCDCQYSSSMDSVTVICPTSPNPGTFTRKFGISHPGCTKVIWTQPTSTGTYVWDITIEF